MDKVACIGTFSIDLRESRLFAALSGDHNPVHVDPAQARRSVFHGTVAHGIHVLLRSLDCLLLNLGKTRVRIKSVSAAFALPARTGQQLEVSIEGAKDDNTKLIVRSGDGMVQKIQVCLVSAATTGHLVRGDPTPACQPTDLDFQAAAAATGRTWLSFDHGTAEMLFPNLCRATSGLALGTLLASTRIVGMDCPGLRSIYSGVTLTWADEANAGVAAANLDYSVVQAKEKLSLLKIALRAPGIDGTVTAFHRPAPVRQISFREAMYAVPTGRFSGAEALVIGGSRGLGELTAKLLAAGGGNVIITYNTGRADAEAVASEICDGAGRCTAFPLDVMAPSSPVDRRPDLGRLEQVYFFAAPFIASGTRRPWDRPLFDRYCDYFVEGMVNSVCALAEGYDLKLDKLAICQPSTSFLDTPDKNFAEYMAAKAAAEAAGHALATRHPGMRFLCPRLPRVLTDQTNAMIPVTTEEAIPLLLPILLAMQSP